VKRSWLASLIALAFMGAAAGFLATHKRSQHLGMPGIRTVAKPIFGFDEAAPTNAPFLASSNSIDLPERLPGFRSREDWLGKGALVTLPKDTTFGRRVYFRSNEPAILCQAVLMGADRTSIHKPQYCLPGMGFQIVSSDPASATILRPYRYELPVMRLNLRAEKRGADGNNHAIAGVYVYWFVTDGELTSSHWDRMKWMARDLLLKGVLQRWAYVSCFTACPIGGEDAAFERVKEFIAASVPEFQLTAGRPVSGERAEAR
jgi:hypothetical protein